MVFITPSISCNKLVRFAGAREEGVGGGSISNLKGGGVLDEIGGRSDTDLGVWNIAEWKTIGTSSSSPESS